jgi:hypothetical protein
MLALYGAADMIWMAAVSGSIGRSHHRSGTQGAAAGGSFFVASGLAAGYSGMRLACICMPIIAPFN